MKTVAIIQARMGSTRFPGKSMAMLGPAPVIEHVVRRVRLAVPVVIVATPNTPADWEMYSFVKTLHMDGVSALIYGGDESDVLGRFFAVANIANAQSIVRITADCPFADPRLIAQLVRIQTSTWADYVTSNSAHPQVDGLDVEVFSRQALFHAARNATSAYDREHVTPFIRRTARSSWCAARTLPLPNPGLQHRWTLDTPADLDWMQSLGEHLDLTPPYPTTDQLVALLEKNPGLCRYANVTEE